MSADNWTTCPRCEDDRRDALAAEEKRVSDLYGKVSVDQFDEARAALDVLRGNALPNTFREDYEFWGAEDGAVQWSYKGHCKTCGASAETQGEVEVTR